MPSPDTQHYSLCTLWPPPTDSLGPDSPPTPKLKCVRAGGWGWGNGGKVVINQVQLLIDLHQVILGFFGPVLPLLHLLLLSLCLFQQGDLGGGLCSQLLLASYLTHRLPLELLLGHSAAKGSASRHSASSCVLPFLLQLQGQRAILLNF